MLSQLARKNIYIFVHVEVRHFASIDLLQPVEVESLMQRVLINSEQMVPETNNDKFAFVLADHLDLSQIFFPQL